MRYPRPGCTRKTDHLEKAYQKLKSMKLSDLQMKADEYKIMLKNQHEELKLLKARLKQLTKRWNLLIANYRNTSQRLQVSQ